MRMKKERPRNRVQSGDLSTLKMKVTGMIIPNSCFSILFVDRNLYNMEKIGTDAEINFNPNFGLSPTLIKGRWEEIFIRQDFYNHTDLDNSTDFWFQNFNVRVFIANSPWKESSDSYVPLKGVQLFLGMAPVTKSWMYPFSFTKKLEEVMTEK